MARDKNKTEKTIDFYKLAIEIIEQQRSTINTDLSKIGFMGDKEDIYSEMIDLLTAENRNILAFEYTERAKSRALVDLLASKKSSDIKTS